MLAVAVAGFLPAVTFAEGDGNVDWAEKAAVEYMEKADKAAAEGNAHDAGIYTKMAQIKRDAGAAAKAGKEFSWDEYHALSGQLGGGQKDKGKKSKDTKWKDKDGDKKSKYKEKPEGKKAQIKAKEKGNAADGFIKTAQQYQQKSIDAMKSGDTEKASIYMELAKMKLDAATAAGQGKGYDWTQYHELLKQLKN